MKARKHKPLKHESKHAHKHAGNHVSKKASMQVSKHASKDASKHSSKQASTKMLDGIHFEEFESESCPVGACSSYNLFLNN